MNIHERQLAYILINGGTVRDLDNGEGGAGPKNIVAKLFLNVCGELLFCPCQIKAEYIYVKM